MSIKALVFDFDGLIIDTETPDFEAWQSVYRKYGFDFQLTDWQKSYGTGRNEFDPTSNLAKLIGKPELGKMIDHEQRVISLSKIVHTPALPGVKKILISAKNAGLKLGIASNSSADWVLCNLARLGFLEYFDSVSSGDDVSALKPDPAVFKLSVSELGVCPEEAIVLEDSPNGITAAINAGIFCVAIPNKVLGKFNVDHANLVLGSLDEISIQELISLPGKTKMKR